MSVILVTGATSPLGRIAAGYLKSLGHRVIGTVRHSGRRLDRTLFDETIVVDFLRRDFSLAIDRPYDSVIHIAALSTGTSRDIMQVSGLAVESLVERSIQLGAKKFVLVSSMSVYGQPTTSVVSADTPISHSTQFGASKWYGECSLLRSMSEIDGCCVRSPAIVGPGPYRNFLSFLYEAMCEGFPTLTISNPNFQFNNIIHEVTLGQFLAQLSVSSPSGFHAFPVGSSSHWLLSEIIAHMTQRTAYRGRISWVPPKMSPFSIDIEYATKLGLIPLTTEETIRLWLF